MTNICYSLMVKECRVLLGIQHFKECTRRITVVASSNLVHFVDEDQWVLSTDTL